MQELKNYPHGVEFDMFDRHVSQLCTILDLCLTTLFYMIVGQASYSIKCSSTGWQFDVTTLCDNRIYGLACKYAQK